jgi:transcription antitermination factor NusG
LTEAEGLYPIQVQPNAEEGAVKSLKTVGFRVYYPHFPSFHEWRGRDKRYSRLVLVPKRPLLPSYLFVDPRHEGGLRFDRVLAAPLVTRFVSPAGYPCPIPGKAMEKIMGLTDPTGAVLPDASGEVFKSGKVKPKFAGKVGDYVRLGGGMGVWAGFEEAIREIDPSGQIIVEIQLFARPTPISVPFDECEIIQKPKAG